MGRERAFYDKDFHDHLGGTIFWCGTFICFALCVIGTPMGMLMIHSDYPKTATDPAGMNPCYTLWGAQADCLATTYSWRVVQDDCKPKRLRWECAEAFSIVAIFSLFFQFFGAFMQIGGAEFKIPLLVLSCLSIVATIIPWAIISSFYLNEFCEEDILTKKHTSLGHGYALFVSSFCVQVLHTVAFLLLEPGRIIKKRLWVDKVEEEAEPACQ